MKSMQDGRTAYGTRWIRNENSPEGRNPHRLDQQRRVRGQGQAQVQVQVQVQDWLREQEWVQRVLALQGARCVLVQQRQSQ